jgi:hypothetical protein
MPKHILHGKCTSLYIKQMHVSSAIISTKILCRSHYRNLALCRVFFFSDTRQRALYRVPRKKPSVKDNTRRRSSLSSVLFLTLGKEFLCRVSLFGTRQRALCRLSQIQHSAKSSLPSAFFPTLGKDNLKSHFKAVN